MSDQTIIAWTEHTWNPWRGCEKISPGCAHCYMFSAQRRMGWNPEVVVRTTTWPDPKRWEREAAARGRTALVFTCSWSDWFHADADPWRDEAWAVIRACPHLHFQILTKRHERIADHLPADWGPHGYPNVWLGVSIENNAFVHRADTLRQIPAVVRFISAEPLLGPLPRLDLTYIDWLIVGGESGPGYRPMQVAWVRELRAKAKASGTAFFFKQSAAPRTEMGIELDGKVVREYPQPRKVVLHPTGRLF
jgi:protein gp37